MPRRAPATLKPARFDEHGETFQSGGRLIGMAKHRQVRRRAHKARQKKPTVARWRREPLDACLDRLGRQFGVLPLLRWIDRACGSRLRE